MTRGSGGVSAFRQVSHNRPGIWAIPLVNQTVGPREVDVRVARFKDKLIQRMLAGSPQ